MKIFLLTMIVSALVCGVGVWAGNTFPWRWESRMGVKVYDFLEEKCGNDNWMISLSHNATSSHYYKDDGEWAVYGVCEFVH